MRKPLALIAVLALAGVALLAPAANAGKTPTLAVSIKDNFFSPKKKSIKKGTKVTWTWKGSVLHNVTLVSAPKGIKTSKYRASERDKGTFVRTLSTPGKWFFTCTLHANMDLNITVTK